MTREQARSELFDLEMKTRWTLADKRRVDELNFVILHGKERSK